MTDWEWQCAPLAVTSEFRTRLKAEFLSGPLCLCSINSECSQCHIRWLVSPYVLWTIVPDRHTGQLHWLQSCLWLRWRQCCILSSSQVVKLRNPYNKRLFWTGLREKPVFVFPVLMPPMCLVKQKLQFTTLNLWHPQTQYWHAIS